MLCDCKDKCARSGPGFFCPVIPKALNPDAPECQAIDYMTIDNFAINTFGYALVQTVPLGRIDRLSYTRIETFLFDRLQQRLGHLIGTVLTGNTLRETEYYCREAIDELIRMGWLKTPVIATAINSSHGTIEITWRPGR